MASLPVTFVPFAALFDGVGVAEAFTLSARAFQLNLQPLAVFAAIAILLLLAGLATMGVGLVLALPWIAAASYAAWKDVFAVPDAAPSQSSAAPQTALHRVPPHECIELRIGRSGHGRHLAYARQRRTAPAPGEEGVDVSGQALHHHLDGAVGAVADPADDAVIERGLHGGIAVTHALHAPVGDDQERDRVHRRRCQAKSAAMLLPSVNAPRSNAASSSASLSSTTSRNSPSSSCAPTWVSPVATKTSMASVE